MTITRRTLLKTAAAGAVAAAATPAQAAERKTLAPDAEGLLYDSTLCIGCRACVTKCKEANKLPSDVREIEGVAYDAPEDLNASTKTVIQLWADDERSAFIKRQCMHCLDPACASACLAKALEKTAAGPVVYHKERCLGCRYCMVACQFDVPKFEFDSPAPYVSKCSFCAERQAQGQLPACASVCPSGALQFGHRAELIEEARARIYKNDGKYVHHIYGETEAGGTNWLYLTDVPFESLGFRTDLGPTSPPELTRTALAAVPFVLTLWPPLLMGLYSFSKRREAAAGESRTTKEAHHD